MTAPLGAGTWRVWVHDRVTGQPVLEFDRDYAAQWSWAMSEPGTASVTMDRTRARELRGGQLIPWRHELVFDRVGDGEQGLDMEHWGGPIDLVTDTPGGQFIVTAQDRAVWATEMRSWKHTGTLAADPARIVAAAFAEAEVGDPTGLLDMRVLRNGAEALEHFTVAGKRIGQTLEAYSVAAPWTVQGTTLTLGALEHHTGLQLDDTAWEDPNDAPQVTDDGARISTRTHIELRDGTVVSWPAAATWDRDTQPGLVERFYSLDVTPAEALALAKANVERSQRGLYVGGSSGAFSVDFPMTLAELRLGLLFDVRTQDLGSLLETGDVGMLSTLSCSIQDGAEQRVAGVLSPRIAGTEVAQLR